MPSHTPKQARTMAKASNDPAFAAKMGIPVKVAREFFAADKAKARAMPSRSPFRPKRNR